MTPLIDLVEVVPTGPDRFQPVTISPLARPTLFGGALVAHALRAAGATVEPDRYPQSLHVSFLRAGRADRELEYRVDRVRDGRSFSTRQVEAVQGERVVMQMTASFCRDEPSPEYQAPARRAAEPDDVPEAARSNSYSLHLDVRELADPHGAEAPMFLAWFRAQEELPVDRVLHACVLAMLSDTGAPGVAAAAIGLRAGGPDREDRSTTMTTSLEHSMWFHRAGRIDDWVLVDAAPLSTAGSRGLLLGSIHDRAGRRLATFSQELLIRASGPQ